MCLFENCGKSLSGKRPANIKRHYLTVHKVNIDARVEEHDSDSNSDKLDTNKIVSNVQKDKNILEVCMDKNQFLRCCLGLVTVKGIAFRLLDDEYFKKIILPYEKKFNLHLNSRNIVSYVENASDQIKNIITRRVGKRKAGKKMLSLKLDIASRMERSLLGVNVQYIKDAKIVIHTLGQFELIFLRYLQTFKFQV